MIGGNDFTARPKSGSAGIGRGAIHSGGNKRLQAEEMALEMKIPLIRLIDSFGGDVRATAEMGRTYLPD